MEEASNGEGPESSNLRESTNEIPAWFLPFMGRKSLQQRADSTLSAQPIQPVQTNIPHYQSNQWQRPSNSHQWQRHSYPSESLHEMQIGEKRTADRNWGSLDEVGSQRSDGDERQVAQHDWARSQRGHWSKREAPRRGEALEGCAGTHARTSWNNHWRGAPKRELKREERNFDRVGCDWRNDTSPSEIKRARGKE